ncbi:lytic transglycosylase domain-containing protein [Panacibacter ginsenosidivorans]|uniref:Lytic transglycosylase domain-containing protein n=1 Tax=Panacibacter ginsenosidivorans TaxID=1813871 RepID=A0A5B8V8Y9_9BACT|nr:lytic transglycosylase domain-containing protein [Panacibacter ginsenosidivorans]QEC67605.1 lytic transglycosylase domain-containing protein [Panacibacter ginsenosidivorans]
MHKNFFHKKTSLLKKVIPLAIMLMLGCTLMSFTIYTPLSKPLSTNPEDGEKDSVKGFRNLLSSNITSNNTTVLFEINARVVPFVTDYLKKQSGNLEKMRSWGQPYFMIYEHVLSSNGLPVELKYLSVVESNLQPGAVSYAGAVGPWQLMPDEAKRFGLKVIPGYDERTNVLKSTEAATKLLKELYSEYKDWLLVIAAYNCGKGGVNRAIVKSGSRNFYDLQMYLSEETRNHVKKYIATHYFFEGGGGWTTITAKETEEKKETLAYLLSRSDTTTNANTISFEITGKYNSLVAANILMMSIGQFNAFNPYFDKTLSEGKPYTVKLPQDKMDIFKTRRQQILYESVQLLLNGTSALPISTVTAVK